MYLFKKDPSEVTDLTYYYYQFPTPMSYCYEELLWFAS
jgi:hypothetical protein